MTGNSEAADAAFPGFLAGAEWHTAQKPGRLKIMDVAKM